MTTPQDIMNKIKQDHVTPTPAWKCTMKEVGIWSACSFGIVGLAVALAVTFFIISSNDWDVYDAFAPNIISFTLVTLPYVWLLVAGGVVMYLIVTFRKTKRGYRIRTATIVLCAVAISASLAGILHAYELGEKVDDTLTRQVPHYATIAHQRDKRWHKPERGIIAGKITDIPTTTAFTIRDRQGKTWHITVSSTQNMRTGTKMRIIGATSDDGTIIAKKVLKWKGNKLTPQHTFQRQKPQSERKNSQLRTTKQKGPQERQFIHTQ